MPLDTKRKVLTMLSSNAPWGTRVKASSVVEVRENPRPSLFGEFYSFSEEKYSSVNMAYLSIVHEISS